MCNKSTAPAGMQTRSMIKKQAGASLKPARKTRTKTRKPKFLSLLNLEVLPEKPHMDETQEKKQLNLFPLHPENLVQERGTADDDDVVFLLDSSDGSATLNGLLDNGSVGVGVDTPTTTTAGVSSEDLTSSYAYRDQDCATTSLLRTAMKGKERDESEEKWVYYSEVTSCAADVGCETTMQRRLGLLSLKLDYEEIMNAWSDKGSLYLEGESSQTVPDLHDELFPHENANVSTDGWGNAGNVWRVPEIGGGLKVKEEVGKSGGLKVGQREASVLRYKEKRQNRLFSKRIRYEVRKLNAEKRPRIKGRFVRRS